ncbi:MAG TPA: S41 family peptidase [Chitinispirillaceae bacterium]|nr:S41 family peptidase [Chitinispirillaceae bacterium]
MIYPSNPDKAEFESVWQYLKAFSVYQDESIYNGRILESPYLYKNTQMMLQMIADTLRGESYTHYVDQSRFEEYGAVTNRISNSQNVVTYKDLTESTGILTIVTFLGNDIYQQFLKCITQIRPTCKNLIIDVRENLGGSITEVDSIIEAFLPAGKEYIKARERNLKFGSEAATIGWHSWITSRPNNTAFNHVQNWIVWMNGNSASASEILAVALKEGKSARLVGSRSYGKGIGQILLKRHNRLGLQITFLQLKGCKLIGDYHGIGIKPDVEIKTNDTASVIRLVEPSYIGRTTNATILSVNKTAVPACYKIIDEDSLLNSLYSDQ